MLKSNRTIETKSQLGYSDLCVEGRVKAIDDEFAWRMETVATSDIRVNDKRNVEIGADGSLLGGNDSVDLNRDKLSMAARCPQHRSGSILNPVAFDALAESSDELWIELEGQLYRLRKTKQGKLILTK